MSEMTLRTSCELHPELFHALMEAVQQAGATVDLSASLVVNGMGYPLRLDAADLQGSMRSPTLATDWYVLRPSEKGVG